MIDVQLENLILREIALDLVGQQRLIELAGVGFFARQKEVARNLLGDSRRTLPLAATDEVGTHGAHDSGVVDPAVLVETVILSRKDCIFHDSRDVRNSHDGTTLFAVFANQESIGGIHTQRNFGPIICKHLKRRQVRVGQHKNDQRHRHPDGDKTNQKYDRIYN